MTTESEILDFINIIEDKFPVSSWKINGIHVWPRVRQKLCDYMAFGYSDDEKRQNVKPEIKSGLSFTLKYLFRNPLNWARGFIGDYKHNDKMTGQVDAVFLTQSMSRRAVVDGRRYDIFCEPIIEQLESIGKRLFVWEWAPNEEYFLPRHNKSFFIEPYFLAARILHGLYWAKTKVDYRLERYEEFVNFLKGKEIFFRYSKKSNLAKDFLFARRIADFYKKWLVRLQPTFGFVVCYYGSYGFPFCLACNELGILSIDIQHGFQGEHHFAYGRWKNVPDDGYKLLPRIFLCWNEGSVVAIERWAKDYNHAHQAVLGGFPWLEMWLRGDSDIVKHYDEVIASIKSKKTYRKYILVTLDTSEGYLIQPQLLEAMKIGGDSWFWWLRMHPGQKGRDDVKRLVKAHGIRNVEIDEATDLPLHAMLRHVDCHVTQWSSVVLEAEAFGIPSVLTTQNGAVYYAEQIVRKSAKVANDASEILSLLESDWAHKQKERHKNDIGSLNLIDALYSISLKTPR